MGRLWNVYKGLFIRIVAYLLLAATISIVFPNCLGTHGILGNPWEIQQHFELFGLLMLHISYHLLRLRPVYLESLSAHVLLKNSLLVLLYPAVVAFGMAAEGHLSVVYCLAFLTLVELVSSRATFFTRTLYVVIFTPLVLLATFYDMTEPNWVQNLIIMMMGCYISGCELTPKFLRKGVLRTQSQN